VTGTSAPSSDRAAARRLGVLGGTFNPPHLGHLLIAQEAFDQLDLDRVLLIPTAQPPHKEVPHDPGAAARLAMVEAAIAGDDRFAASPIEIERGGPSYTVDTLRALHATYPGSELTFVVGGDMASSLPTWHEPAEVVAQARLAVAEREGTRRTDILERLATIPGAVEQVDFFDLPRIDFSSSLVRRRVAAGRPITYLVPDRVAAYIAQHGLYRSPVGSPTSA
jgi:nicotinate-nucleotide adenylyltransferase